MSEKLEYIQPTVIELGDVCELTGSGGANNDDGWYYSRTPK